MTRGQQFPWSSFLALALLVGQGASLLFEPEPCAADASVCTCTGLTIRCDARGLTSVPKFIQTAQHYSLLDLSNNNITSLTASAFANLTVQTIDLSNNPITTFTPDALDGLEDVLNTLELNNCGLTEVPAAVGKLKRLRTLDLMQNPQITSLPAGIMAAVGVTLENLDISNTGLTTWPTDGLNSTFRLRSLRVSGNHLASIPDDAFHPFAATLYTLDLSYNQLKAFPAAINELRVLRTLDLSFNMLGTIAEGQFTNCKYSLTTLHLVHVFFREIPFGLRDLRSLEELYLSYNPINTAESDVFTGSISGTLKILHLDHSLLPRIPSAINGLLALRELNFTWNRVQTVEPYSFSQLAQLETLYLDKNPIANIKYAAFGGLNKLKKLYVRNTSLTYVPNAALGQIPQLQLADFSNNKIQALYDYGFPGMGSLTEVRLSGNPLSNISANAFDDLSGVHVLNLERCQLREVPRAVQKMHSLWTLRMEGNPVECTCPALGWVENWQANQGLIAKVDGHCGNSTKLIQDFMDNDASSCP